MVIDNQRFIVARDINGEPSGAGERAADQTAGSVRLPQPALCRHRQLPKASVQRFRLSRSYRTAWPSVEVPWIFDSVRLVKGWDAIPWGEPTPARLTGNAHRLHGVVIGGGDVRAVYQDVVVLSVDVGPGDRHRGLWACCG